MVSFFTNNLEIDTRLSTIETKTQNQTAEAGTTAFNNVIATSFTKYGGLATEFLKANGTVDTSTHLTNDSAGTSYVAETGGVMTGILYVQNIDNIGTPLNLGSNIYW